MEMHFQTLQATALLFGMGMLGWFLLSRLHIPAPEIMGPIVLIGAFRALHIDLPSAPAFLFPIAQVIIGIFVGSMLDKDSVRHLKAMATSALIVVIWALSMIVIIGFFLHRYSAMDPPTAFLSASMGGLPEISVLAVASGASAAVVILMQMLRMLGSIMLFPAILKWIEGRHYRNNRGRPKEPPGPEALPPLKTESAPSFGSGTPASGSSEPGRQGRPFYKKWGQLVNQNLNRAKLQQRWLLCRQLWPRVLLTGIVAAAGGLLLYKLGIPAGLMVGSTFAIAAVSVAGLPVSRVSSRLLNILLVAIGITLADNITPETLHAMADARFLVPILIATSAMFASSYGIAWVIFRLTDWDFPTSLLAAAPGGFTVMTALAIKHGLDPLKISMVHLCRLLAIKMFVPLVIMTMM